MSLARTALRIAAVAALNADPIIAGLCPGRVYDSRIDELDAQDPVPVIVIFTEDDKGHAWSVNNGGPPFDHACDLLIEISMRVLVPEGGDSDDVRIGLAETDTEAEIALDLLEERAVEAVTIADTPQARLIREFVTRRTTELKSIRFASADSGSKLALRMVTLTTHLKINQPDARDVATGPFAVLPQPLRTVAEAQPTTSAAYTNCLGLVAKMTGTAPPQMALTGIDMEMQPRRLCADEIPEVDDPQSADTINASIDL